MAIVIVADPKIYVDCIVECPELSFETDPYQGLLEEVLREHAVVSPSSTGLIFVDKSKMSELNFEYRSKSGPTDVLSFLIDGPFCLPDQSNPLAFGQPQGPALVEGEDSPGVMVGDIVICPEVAQDNCEEHGSSLEDEVALLVVHGALHLLGYDHEEEAEAKEMEALESKHLAAYWRPRC